MTEKLLHASIPASFVAFAFLTHWGAVGFFLISVVALCFKEHLNKTHQKHSDELEKRVQAIESKISEFYIRGAM